MYKKACKIVVLLIKPIAFVALPLPWPSLDLKVPITMTFSTSQCQDGVKVLNRL